MYQNKTVKAPRYGCFFMGIFSSGRAIWYTRTNEKEDERLL